MPIDNNFRLLTLPFGELTGYSLGAGTVFQGSTPVMYFEDSLNRLGAFLQQRPTTARERGCRSGESSANCFDRIIRENTAEGQRGEIGRTQPTFPPANDCVDPQGNPIDCADPRAGEPVAGALRRGTLTVDRPCGTFDFGCYLERFFTGETAKDLGKRIALLLVALVILGAAIVSLR